MGLAERAGRAADGLEAGAEAAFVDLVLLDDLGADLAGLDDGGTALGEEDGDAAHDGVVGVNVTLDGFALTADLEAEAAADVEARGGVIHAAEEAGLPFRGHCLEVGLFF